MYRPVIEGPYRLQSALVPGNLVGQGLYLRRNLLSGLGVFPAADRGIVGTARRLR